MCTRARVGGRMDQRQEGIEMDIRIKRFALAISILLVSVGAEAAGEYVFFPIPQNFIVLYQERDGAFEGIQYAPEAETKASWTRMLNSIRISGWAKHTSPAEFSLNMIRGGLRKCPGFTASPIIRFKLDGKNAAKFRLDCPINPESGRPETAFSLVLEGTQDLYLIQASFSGKSTKEQVEWAESVIAKSHFCSQGRKVTGC
jgi:hypothetical protein